MPKKFKHDGEPELHERLKGFNIYINEFGEVVENFGKEKLNYFLNSAMAEEHKREEEE